MSSTHNQDVFYFYPDERPCNGFSEALERYREFVPHLRLAGLTSFAPIIAMAMTIVERSGGQYHVLLMIADGQCERKIGSAAHIIVIIYTLIHTHSSCIRGEVSTPASVRKSQGLKPIRRALHCL
ncbi:hypothetical protein ACP70R_000844 [Stipagrostis hirtigluma subsp. patula]